MATEIRVPTLGESVSEATVGTWFKKVGDAIRADEPILELETDKVTIEVPAPASGTLSEIVAQAGETVGLGALLGQIAAGAGAAAAPAPAAAPAKAAEPAAAAPALVAAAAAPAASASAMPPAPAAAKMLAENSLSADQVDGSGKRGQVLKGDVIAAVAKGISAPAAAAAPAVPAAARGPSTLEDAAREERVKMTRLRQTIAKRLKDAQNTAAMLTTYNEVDMKAVMDLRAKYKDVFEKKHGVKLGFMGFFTKAITHALKELPAVNAEIDGTDIIYKNFCHIGMAVGTDKGLVVPVIRDADQMSIAEVEKELARLAKAARDGSLSMADMQGGTFTITNGGVYGSLMSSPILNAPQSGILGMHKIQDRPVVVGGQIVIRPMMYLALSYDHRIVDGKEAVTFLVRVKESLEDPERLVLDL
ncbi:MULTISPECIES: 2-oxoglutarate dehydrogenase complex dihydrolipoyllysine-residue succinyltransferase [unclassified Rhizobium]|uniref:2-oxoglutarate dehydrogenase complex dihydrolipoyllysine-residue succinyltransferase n=1 Tax=unclassified Rhizobium TaxID=2613769 RepID=UPI00104DC066|nr:MULTISPECIES: 2-oxoglutarate dehydrogenase complex dihydrolipoyllysine-residue succinyltransferase [unclassified Rhizobium]MBB3395650.1 2-oxoglutarate dehydrogenase E2 component (dihydrolipoamide succinyltransferase) [Rhizobium sp. BK060]MBB4168300.1 2-oxoglutarate dehydrogenase E2 component (dihydrolipoamide succinyltransferase) [Rhizobium sp. BK538]TCM79728.1 2-oxoglutarate dehydrogenase E2 component [Rhizobium sp. BK068]